MALTADKFIITNGTPTGGKQPMQSSTIGAANLWDFGLLDYNDLATATTPISVPATNTYIALTNDGAGSFTNKMPPGGVTDVWDTVNNRFDFSELSIGDMVDIRLDIEVTTSANNQEYTVVLELAQGGSAYEIPFVTNKYVKTTGVDKLNIFNGVYLGDANTQGNYAQFKIKSPSSATVKVNGWYCKVIKKGYV